MSKMSVKMKADLHQILILHEGRRHQAYYDTKGIITIGVGRNLTGSGLSNDEIDLMLENDIEYFYKFLDGNYPWFKSLSEARQVALVDMCFMGTKTFSTFH